jgi:hypothetical protein
MSLWDVMVSIFWFMLLVAWFWLLMSIITDVFRDDDLSGVAKGAWCIFVVLLPWVGVLTYLIVRGRSMSERAGREAARNEQAFRSYVRDVAASESHGVSGDLTKLADMRERGLLTPEEYDQAKLRVLGTPAPTPAGASQRAAVADNLPA